MDTKLLQLHKHKGSISGNIQLPASKSISNRVLIINALSYSPLPIENLADCQDTVLLQKALYATSSNTFHTGDGGTTIRFLTAFLSKIIGEWTVQCSQSMKQRPIKTLVDALNTLGAQISYLEKEGYPPLKIQGCYLTGNTITLNGGISSQFISALLLIAPTLPNGLALTLTDKIVSRPYIEMTLSIMKEFGIDSFWKKNTIHIAPKSYKVQPYKVEADWSAASYFYALLALAQKGSIQLTGLFDVSCQGDQQQIVLWEQLGVKTSFTNNGILIRYDTHTQLPNHIEQNFSNMPDLAQTFAVVYAMLGIPFSFTGIETLYIKETNRIVALCSELKKLGYQLQTNEQTISWDGTTIEAENNPTIATYNDHRMAMAFAPIAIFQDIQIENPSVVKKSYPKFWEDFEQIWLD